MEEVTRALGALAPRTNHKDEIRRILTRLGFATDGDIADQWFKIVKAHKFAHGGRQFNESQEMDSEFITNFQQPFDIVIRSVVTALRGHYAALMRRVEALVAMQDRNRAVKLFAREIPGAPQLQWHFFNNLTTGDWLEPLGREGFLGEPIRFAGDDGEGRFYGEWPAGKYLLRMAASDDRATRQRVIAALQALSNADHPDILDGGIAILVALPPAEAAPLADLAVRWLSRDERALSGLAPTDLVKRLAEAGERRAALRIAREAFRLWGDDGHIKDHFSEHMYEHHLPAVREVLTNACGGDALELLIDCLRQAVTIDGRYSHRSMNSVSHVNSPPFDIPDVLMTAVRQTAEESIRNSTVPMTEVIGMLAENDGNIFVRLALHVLAQHPASAPGVATSYLLKKELITADWCNAEYATLAIAWFPSLSPEEQAKVLQEVDAVPAQYLDWWTARFEAQHNAPPSAQDVEKFKVDCVQDLLWRWREVLPPSRREAIEKIGDPRAWRAALAAPDESPLTSADFTNEPIEEVIAFLKSWQPSGQPARVTINAVGQAVRAAAMAQPETFSTAADQFSGLRPIYIRRLLEGLQQAAGSRKKINWKNVLALIAFTCTKASSITGGAPLAEGDDATFAWACKAAAELLMAGLRLGTSAIGVEHRAAIRSLVKGTLKLVPATVEVENFADKFEEYPYFTAQQTFRGVATELCVLLIRWEQLNAASVSGNTRAAISEDPEIRNALEALLADRSSDGCIPRAVIGRYLQLLHWSDQEWVRSHVPYPLSERQQRVEASNVVLAPHE